MASTNTVTREHRATSGDSGSITGYSSRPAKAVSQETTSQETTQPTVRREAGKVF